jgi:YD repeat-containing protein
MKHCNRLSTVATLAMAALLIAAAAMASQNNKDCVDKTWNTKQRTVYDKSGRVLGQITTDSAGTRTIYGADGRVVAREATDTQGTTTIYDAAGSKVGTTTTPRKRCP